MNLVTRKKYENWKDASIHTKPDTQQKKLITPVHYFINIRFSSLI